MSISYFFMGKDYGVSAPWKSIPSVFYECFFFLYMGKGGVSGYPLADLKPNVKPTITTANPRNRRFSY